MCEEAGGSGPPFYFLCPLCAACGIFLIGNSVAVKEKCEAFFEASLLAFVYSRIFALRVWHYAVKCGINNRT